MHSLIPFHSLIPWRQCLLSGGTEACSLRLRETPACIHIIQRLSQPRVACWHGFRPNSQKTECVFTRCPDMRSKKKIACIHGLRSEGVNEDRYVPQEASKHFVTSDPVGPSVHFGCFLWPETFLWSFYRSLSFFVRLQRFGQVWLGLVRFGHVHLEKTRWLPIRDKASIILTFTFLGNKFFQACELL